MQVISYKKTDGSSTLVEIRDMKMGSSSLSQIERFHAFFQDVPLHGGKEWKTLHVDEIVLIFRNAATNIVQECQQRHDTEIQEYSARNRFAQWWMKLRGWKVQCVPSEEVVIQSMADQCELLSNWMRENSSRPFYAGSDMSVFINKPLAVANQLIDV